METRKERFKRLANARVNNTLKQIELVGNLSNKSMYDYSEEDVKKMFSVLESSIREARLKFRLGTKKKFRI